MIDPKRQLGGKHRSGTMLDQRSTGQYTEEIRQIIAAVDEARKKNHYPIAPISLVAEVMFSMGYAKLDPAISSMIATCAGCGRPFIKRKPAIRFCSASCYRAITPFSDEIIKKLYPSTKTKDVVAALASCGIMRSERWVRQQAARLGLTPKTRRKHEKGP